MWIERLMAGISHQHVLSYNPKKQKLKIMKKGGVKTFEDGEIINDCFLLNEYKRLFWREK